MSPATLASSQGTMSIVPERRSIVHLTFGLMALVFAATLGLAGFVEDAASRWALEAIGGILLAGVLIAWIHTIRNPARLEVTPESITLARGARPNLRQLRRGAGVLQTISAGWRNGQVWLVQEGSDERMLIGVFDRRAVRAAAVAQGWTWVE